MAVADFSQVHAGDHAQTGRQPLEQQADQSGSQQNPEELQGDSREEESPHGDQHQQQY